MLLTSIKITEKPFHLSDTSEEEVFKIMQGIDISKAAGIDNLSGKFLKDGTEILAKPLNEICNLPITSRTFFRIPVKLQSSNLFLRKAKKIDPSNYRPISLPPLIS